MVVLVLLADDISRKVQIIIHRENQRVVPLLVSNLVFYTSYLFCQSRNLALAYTPGLKCDVVLYRPRLIDYRDGL